MSLVRCRLLFASTSQSLCSPSKKFCTSEASVKELSTTSTLLRNLRNGAEIYLVGTAHISKLSASEVRDMVRLVKPETIMLELCKSRLEKLRNNNRGPPSFLKTVMANFGVSGSLQADMLGAGLSSIYAILRMLGLEPGAEFRAGIEEADRTGAVIVCGDQDQHITAQKISENLQLTDVMKLISSGLTPKGFPSMKQAGSLEDTIEAMKTRKTAREMSTAIRAMNPGVARALIDDRDKILTDSLLGLRGRVVGVVGIAHLDGIERLWRLAMRKN